MYNEYDKMHDAGLKWLERLRILGLAALAAAIVLIAAGKITAAFMPEPAPEPVHAQQIMATYGSLDETCVVRYYKKADYAEPPVQAGHRIAWDGRSWVCAECEDLVSTNDGDCWQAVFVPAPEKTKR